MSFCTAINCLDGRAQLPVISYLTRRFGVEFVDVVSEAGPAGILACNSESQGSRSIFRRIDISIEAHQSRAIAIVAHHDCAGNPKPATEQIKELRKCVEILRKSYSNLPNIAVWLDADQKAAEIGEEI
ncbi:MAG: hypothetical protein O3B01_21195 [Planctomycetota bacterium]|nr:hypothetical protein [Planctomycetota bacterium]MDA1141091.1 hypothetical protein [Planctomycetota bacterium]